MTQGFEMPADWQKDGFQDRPGVAAGYGGGKRQAQFQGPLERTKKGGANVVFIGDSITIGWVDAGIAEWAKRFEPLGAVDYGIGGDSRRQVSGASATDWSMGSRRSSSC